MQHTLCKDYQNYWKTRRTETSLPAVTTFSDASSLAFKENYVRFSLDKNDIVISAIGERVEQSMPAKVAAKFLTDIYPLALKPTQMALIMPCFTLKAGFNRLSRIWYGHRHKIVEWLLLPVQNTNNGQIELEGVIVSKLEQDSRDELAIGSSMIERIITQNYISCDQAVNLHGIDQHSWAVLDAMGADILIDGSFVEKETGGLGGEAALMASKAARSNVLAVANEEDFSSLKQRLSGRYNLKLVSSFDEAKEILKIDMIDVLVVSETFSGGVGLDLVNEALEISPFSASVLMLDRKDNREDARIVENGNFIQCLVKPVGEFALRQALDDASEHVNEKRSDI